jgi:hypothetical protein
MRVAVRKLPVEDVEKLQALVVENFDAIEPGLTVLDARLLLGHATIDVIGVDSVGALVLGNIGFSANEDMLLKAVEAYSWCLEYPEALVRLYPSCQLSDDRPPRLLFVVERMSDAFHRKIKQLGFPEVDCVEFRHLEFDGVPAVYFESLLRLRRGLMGRSVPTDAPPSAPVATDRGGAQLRATGVKSPKVQPGPDGPANSPRAAERRTPSREPAAVVSMVTRQNAVAAPWVDRPRPEPVVLREPEPLTTELGGRGASGDLDSTPDLAAGVVHDEPVAVTPAPESVPEPVAMPAVPDLAPRPAVVDMVPSIAPAHVLKPAKEAERVSFKDLADSLLGAMTKTQAALTHTPGEVPARPAVAEPLVVESSAAAPASPGPSVAPLELRLDKELPTPPIEEIVALAVESVDSTPSPVLTLESASSSPASTPERPVAEADKPAAPAMPQGFEGLKFPNDGVLTRQWMEFLSQMSTTK